MAKTAGRLLARVATVCVALVCFALPARAHPHVFVDGGVDFLFDDANRLTALDVTWLYDEFETLYILASYGVSMNAAGKLDAADRRELARERSKWPSEFEGSAHVSIEGESVALSRPVGMETKLVNGRLEVTFTRHLETPVVLNEEHAEVAFYEATYFYAFAVTNVPKLVGETGACNAEVLQYDPTAQNVALELALSKLSREETPDIEDVGALFADRIELRCG